MKQLLRQIATAMVIILLTLSSGVVFAKAATSPQENPAPQTGPADNTPSDADKAVRLTSEQLEQLVAPIALYPDSLLAQIFMAATYPLEVVSAARWSKANPKVQGKDLDTAMQQQAWDPSVKSLTAFPQVLQMMNEKLDWTQKLGDTFLSQQKDTMDAVQRLRAKAQAQGALTSSKEQTVSVDKSSGASSQVIVIQPAQPDVVYVPTYNPTVVYGVWPYPSYPPYSWYPPGYVATTNILSFGLGVATGYALWGNCNWHRGDVDIDINRYNNYTRVAHSSNWQGSGNNWQHNPEHRKGVPYHNPDVAKQFQGRARTDIRDQERARARESFRGRTGGDRPDRIQRPGEGGHGRRIDGEHIQRPGEGGRGQRIDGDRVQRQRDGSIQRPGTGRRDTLPGPAGERSRPGGRGEHSGADISNRSAFHGVEHGQRAHTDKLRGAGSRQTMRSHSGEGHNFQGGGRFQRR